MNDHWYMKHALQLAAAMKGQTTPNPMVGAVVVKDGMILGTGAHMRAGEDHAEVIALRMAPGHTDGATMYVTLEPCNHFGKTPPCTQKIIEAGIKRVVVAGKDRNPQVAGSGIDTLRKANIEVEVGVLQEEATKLNEAFFHYMETGTPFVTVKTAATLDGEMVTPNGEPRWITGETARKEVHQLRHVHDAILVGVGTVLRDNPSLTTRLEVDGRNPVRVVLDRSLKTPLDAQLVIDEKAPLWIFTEVESTDERVSLLREKGIYVFSIDSVTPQAVLEELGRLNIQTVLVEGGKTINDAFISAHQVQRYITYIASKLFGNVNAFQSDVSTNGAVNLEIEEVTVVGDDVKITAKHKEGVDDVHRSN
ncbi:diaminohydroxyphosphoribosylaminopyrimidine deaminase/5-amino-6-(5-phosphoribosylamino)uracil reductase [Geomicrobium halophilum]|uniref:Riboflavin biosynthesis protein RibD n=1 Tax=Geomicrobium halophilum TaxID=549000 RepID=A0A841PNJ3_9BACL|nr:bifunctional diaminohydroxyphosphoribosylaminopyrimidine deaminase/5-amino-6-(5-phosphoribosylamino)uracil reductase RibD [Geomicrobium halophilum]MBB6450407.1 diaminohydroxyphosphoribosylaminopyrimidine deaminase/5-amino-6-(5-phosphoribosylamino)uracil reductase [Geomicrobium halophilum]